MGVRVSRASRRRAKFIQAGRRRSEVHSGWAAPPLRRNMGVMADAPRCSTRPPRPSSCAAARSKPLELVDAAIARIEKLDPELGAVITRQFERARAWAAASDLPAGPFRGVPMLLKDLGAHLAGDPVHCGMRALKKARLARAGRVLFRGAPAARGPDLARAHQHAGAGPAADDRARGVRPDPQPVEADPFERRIERRLGVGGGRRAGAGGARQRRRRLDPDSGEPLRPGGAQAHPRAGLVRAGARGALGRLLRRRLRHAIRARHRCAARRRERGARGRSVLGGAAAPPVRERGGRPARAPADRRDAARAARGRVAPGLSRRRVGGGKTARGPRPPRRRGPSPGPRRDRRRAGLRDGRDLLDGPRPRRLERADRGADRAGRRRAAHLGARGAGARDQRRGVSGGDRGATMPTRAASPTGGSAASICCSPPPAPRRPRRSVTSTPRPRIRSPATRTRCRSGSSRRPGTSPASRRSRCRCTRPRDGLPIGVQLVADAGGEGCLLRVAAQLEQAAPWAGRLPPLHAAHYSA